MPNSNISMEKLKRAWYEGGDYSMYHYNWSRYYALNLHAVFSKGTLEWRCFESTLHAGKVRANITLALRPGDQPEMYPYEENGDHGKPVFYVPYLPAPAGANRIGI